MSAQHNDTGQAVRHDPLLGQWIDAKKTKPETTDDVLTFGVCGIVIGSYENGKWHARDTDYESGEPWLCEEGTVTHWIPLPLPPNTGEKAR